MVYTIPVVEEVVDMRELHDQDIETLGSRRAEGPTWILKHALFELQYKALRF